jgi:hypothetical protein
MWLDLKCGVIHQRHVDKIVAIRYLHTSQQLADILTKALTPMVHEKAVAMLGMYCDKLKTIEYEEGKEHEKLVSDGVKIPLKKHSCIYLGEKECITCKRFYAGFV